MLRSAQHFFFIRFPSRHVCIGLPMASFNPFMTDADPSIQTPAEPDAERRTWRRWYSIVLGNLAILIALMYAFTRYFG
jgi:hypothetical protein